MKKIVAVILFTQLFASAMCQKTSASEINVNLGPRKTGLGFSHGIAPNIDAMFNVDLTRYFSIGLEAQMRAYLFSNATGNVMHFGSPFVAAGYEYVSGVKFDKEDSRRFVNGYYVPNNRYITAELGYRFYGKSKTDAAGHTIRNVDVSVSALYYWGMQNGYSASLQYGSDAEGQVNKINKFMNGGWGAAASIHIPLKL